MSGYDDMARHLRDALEEGEVQEDGSCIIRPEHYLQLNADFEAWDEADDAKSAEAEDATPDESSITDAQIEEALRHGFGDQGAFALHRSTPVSGDEVGKGEPIRFGYTNYRGEYGVRTALPMSIHWGTTDWHPEPGWLLTAFDRDKLACRVFALADCNFALHPTDQEAIRREALEEAVRVAEDAAEGARVLHNAASKDHDRYGYIVHGEGWRAGKQIATAIRALMSAPEKEVG